MINRYEVRHRFHIRASDVLSYNFSHEYPMFYKNVIGTIFPKIYFRKLNDRVLVRTCAHAVYYSNIERAMVAGVV